MHVRSSTLATVRHGAGALTEAALLLAIAVALIMGAALLGHSAPAGADAAFARTTSTPWIELTQVDGRSASVQPSLGSTVTFATSYPRTVKNPRIEVLCYQDGDLVFGMAGSVTYAFQLGGAGSTWLTVGGPADCTANLFYFGSHAGKQTYNKLATTSFAAGG